MRKAKTIELRKNIILSDNYDVAVVGGGIAGVAAAVTAARQGASVCIIEKENVFGGLATAANIWVYVAICDMCGRQLVGGMGEELLKLSAKYGRGQIPQCWKRGGDKSKRAKQSYEVRFTPDSYMIALDEICVKAGVKIYFDTRLTDVIIKNKKIEAIVVDNKQGTSAIKCKAVVDASGDADVCHMAGENVTVSKDNRNSCWGYYSVGDKMVQRLAFDPLTGKIPAGSRTYCGVTPDDVTQMIIDSRQMAKKTLAKLKRQFNTDDVAAVKLPTIPPYRMTRRLVGIAELQPEDEHKWFDDAVAIIGAWRKKGQVYAIPVGTLIGEKIKNLATAGRCISSTGYAWDQTRVIPPCAVTGQAAATMAVMVARQNKPMADLDIAAIQKQLKKDKAILNRKLVEQKVDAPNGGRIDEDQVAH